MTFEQQLQKIQTKDGFIAALDQSGGSTPKALRLYGVEESEYSGEEQMFDKIHEMRSRIITDASFGGDRVLGAILFEMTMDREIQGKGSAEFLWQEKQVVPFLKIDKGLEAENDGVQMMKPMPGLDALLDRAKGHGVFGTKERSVVKHANEAGVRAIVDQQFAVGDQVLAKGLVPILEPEVDINSPTKKEAEAQLKQMLLDGLGKVADGKQVMLKLTLPVDDGFYGDVIAHPKVLKVVALSGGYSRDDANAKLAKNPGMIASFSRGLLQDLRKGQSDEEFDGTLGKAIDQIAEASCAG